MINNNNFFTTNGYPYVSIYNSNTMKISHDNYEVYVNKDYVGNKLLLGQNEKITDLNKYLVNNGFKGLTTTLEGNAFIIKSSDKKQCKVLKENLNSYLHLR